MKVYVLDTKRIFSHEVEILDLYAPLPISTSTPPPETTGTEVAKWENGVWEILAEYPQQSLQDLKNALKLKVTDFRWQVETGGLTLQNGVRVATSTADQNRITSVIANAQLAGVTSVDFKAAFGWVTLTLAEVQGIAAAIALHLQACFSAERAHHEAIEALTSIEALQAYDVTAG